MPLRPRGSHKRLSTAQALAAAALWAGTTGCAFGALPLTLPTETPGIPRGVGQGRQTIVMPFTDDRTIRDRGQAGRREQEGQVCEPGDGHDGGA